jgi:branched-chain amino acid transport system substrate-binding protein
LVQNSGWNKKRNRGGILLKKLVVLGLIVLVVAMTSFVGAATEPIKIGANYEITGGVATFGTACANSAKLYFNAVNKKGGVLGRQLELVVSDNKSDAAESASAAKKLIAQDKVVALLGPVTSKNCLSAAPIAQDSKIPMITPTGTNPAVTEVGDYIFRACFIDDFQGTVMANFALKTLKVKTAAIFVDNANDYSKGLAKFFKESFIKGGGKIVSEEAFMAGDKDYRTQLTKIKMKNPAFLYVPAYYQEDGLVAQQARELGINIPMGGGDGWDSPDLVKIAGESALNKIYFSNHYSVDSKNPLSMAYVKEYTATYNMPPDALAALGYDAAIIMVEAIKKAKSVEPAKVRDAMAKLKVAGVCGVVTFDKNRNPVKSAVIIELKNGKQTYNSTVNP